MRLVALQLWALLRWGSYFAHRHRFALAQRLLRVAWVVVLYTDGTYLQSLHDLAASDSGARRNALYICCTMSWLLFHGCVNFPLRWRLSAPLSLAMAACGVALGVPAANCVLHRPGSQLAAATGQLCRSAAGGILAAAELLLPLKTSQQVEWLCAGPRSGATLQLLVIAAGLAASLHLSWVVERRIKRRWLLRCQQVPLQRLGEPGPGAKLLDAACWCCIWPLLCLLAAGGLSSLDWMDARHCSWNGAA